MLFESEFQFPIVEHEIPDEHQGCDLQIHWNYYLRMWNEFSVLAPRPLLLHLPLSLLSDYWLSAFLKKNNTENEFSLKYY